MRASLFFLIFILLGGSAYAEEDCARVADDNARLACYDLKFGVSEVHGDFGGDIGKWRKSVDISKLTDEKSVFLLLASEDAIPDKYGSGRGNAWILLRCMEDTTSAYFKFNEHFMADIQGYGKIEYRLDDTKMTSMRTQESTDNMALGLWRGNTAIPFIKRLLGHETLLVRATPFNESAITVTFDIRGIDTAVKELRETCRW